jgi:hypothetical protein
LPTSPSLLSNISIKILWFTQSKILKMLPKKTCVICNTFLSQTALELCKFRPSIGKEFLFSCHRNSCQWHPHRN